MGAITFSKLMPFVIFVIYIVLVRIAYNALNLRQKRIYSRRVYIYITSVVGMLILIIGITGFLELR